MQMASMSHPLQHFNVYSSVAGLMGSPGQAPHSAANTWLDTFAHWQCRRGVRGQSVNWGAVAEIGYAARLGADQRAGVGGGHGCGVDVDPEIEHVVGRAAVKEVAPRAQLRSAWAASDDAN